jgi:DNA-binding GntR family transcriptional regulator
MSIRLYDNFWFGAERSNLRPVGPPRKNRTTAKLADAHRRKKIGLKTRDRDWPPGKGEAASISAASSGSTHSADHVAEALRVRIQRSEIHAGEWIREAKLCSDFGIGRSVARRALRALADDGLIELEENRGARVSETTVEEVFDLYEVRAALYGLAARVACLRASDAAIADMLVKIDALLAAARRGAPAEEIMEISEAIFTDMAGHASADAQRMIASIRRKTRWHLTYVALAINANGKGPYVFWRHIRSALIARHPDKAGEGARGLIHFMQDAVARILLARGVGRASLSTTRNGR